MVGGGTHLHLRIGPARHLDDHVEDGLLLVGIERDVVEGRDGDAIFLNEDAVLERVGGTDPARRVLARGLGGYGCHCGGGSGWSGVEVACQQLCPRPDFVDGSGLGGAGRRGGTMVISQCDERHRRSARWKGAMRSSSRNKSVAGRIKPQKKRTAAHQGTRNNTDRKG